MELNNSIDSNISKPHKFLYDCKEDEPLFYNFDLRKRCKRLVYLADWFTLVIVLIIGGLLFLKVPVRGRLFTLDDPSIAYPKLDEIIPMQLLIPLIVFIPLLVMITISLVIKRDLNDFHHAALGFAQSMALTLLLTSAIKSYLGGLRPSFLEFCNPTPESIAAGNPPVGYGKIYYDRSICTTGESEINDGLSAYPSGHSSMSATALGYLALYMYARLKMFDNRGHLLIYILVSGCLVGSVLIGISRVADYRHSFLNVLCGWIIGLIIAISCYRLNFSSIFGRDNHKSIHSHWLAYWDHQENLKNCNNNNNNNKLNNSNTKGADNDEANQTPNEV